MRAGLPYMEFPTRPTIRFEDTLRKVCRTLFPRYSVARRANSSLKLSKRPTTV